MPYLWLSTQVLRVPPSTLVPSGAAHAPACPPLPDRRGRAPPAPLCSTSDTRRTPARRGGRSGGGGDERVEILTGPAPLTGPQLVNIHCRLSVLPGDRHGHRHPVPSPPPPDPLKRSSPVKPGARLRWRRGLRHWSETAPSRGPPVAGRLLPWPARPRARYPVCCSGLAPTAT